MKNIYISYCDLSCATVRLALLQTLNSSSSSNKKKIVIKEININIDNDDNYNFRGKAFNVVNKAVNDDDDDDKGIELFAIMEVVLAEDVVLVVVNTHLHVYQCNSVAFKIASYVKNECKQGNSQVVLLGTLPFGNFILNNSSNSVKHADSFHLPLNGFDLSSSRLRLNSNTDTDNSIHKNHSIRRSVLIENNNTNVKITDPFFAALSHFLQLFMLPLCILVVCGTRYNVALDDDGSKSVMETFASFLPFANENSPNEAVKHVVFETLPINYTTNNGNNAKNMAMYA